MTIGQIKVSVFSTVKEQQTKATCDHEWNYASHPFRILDHIWCAARCWKCKGFKMADMYTTPLLSHEIANEEPANSSDDK